VGAKAQEVVVCDYKVGDGVIVSRAGTITSSPTKEKDEEEATNDLGILSAGWTWPV